MILCGCFKNAKDIFKYSHKPHLDLKKKKKIQIKEKGVLAKDSRQG